MRVINSQCDTLGLFLHTPTLKQLEKSDETDFSELRIRCAEVLQLMEGMLSSGVLNINFGVFNSIECMNPDCGKIIRRRLLTDAECTEAECPECGFNYEIRIAGEQFTWRLSLDGVPCPNSPCTQVFKLTKKEMAPGQLLHCTTCGGQFKIGLAPF